MTEICDLCLNLSSQCDTTNILLLQLYSMYNNLSVHCRMFFGALMNNTEKTLFLMKDHIAHGFSGNGRQYQVDLLNGLNITHIESYKLQVIAHLGSRILHKQLDSSSPTSRIFHIFAEFTIFAIFAVFAKIAALTGALLTRSSLT